MVSCPGCGATFEADAAESMFAMGIVSYAGCPGCGHEFLPFGSPSAACDQAGRRVEPVPGVGPARFPELGEEDQQQIVALVRSLPGVDRRIIRILRHSNGDVQVLTGELTGRGAGRGGSVVVERADGGWRVKRVSSWLA